MSALAAARVLAVEDAPVVRADLRLILEHAHLLVMVERMSREGYSQSEITWAMDRALGGSRLIRARHALRRWLH